MKIAFVIFVFLFSLFIIVKYYSVVHFVRLNRYNSFEGYIVQENNVSGDNTSSFASFVPLSLLNPAPSGPSQQLLRQGTASSAVSAVSEASPASHAASGEDTGSLQIRPFPPSFPPPNS